MLPLPLSLNQTSHLSLMPSLTLNHSRNYCSLLPFLFSLLLSYAISLSFHFPFSLSHTTAKKPYQTVVSLSHPGSVVLLPLFAPSGNNRRESPLSLSVTEIRITCIRLY
ncbi:hypothetical protein AMTRI_Chr10g225710 [Amborella trichopoda]